MANAVKNLGVGVMRNSVCTALPKISVIMACYNSEKFVGKSIQSVIDQTYSNWELLCVNDMSTDNTLDVLQQYAAKDSRIKVFEKIWHSVPTKNGKMIKFFGVKIKYRAKKI